MPAMALVAQPTEIKMLISYYQDIDNLVETITTLLPKYPEILTMESLWDLLKIEELKIDERQLSLSQVAMAVCIVKQQIKTFE